MSAAWRSYQERSNLFWLGLIAGVGLVFGRHIARLLLIPIVIFFFFVAVSARRHSRAFLRRALGREAHSREVAKHLYFFASTVLDRLFLAAGRYDSFQVTSQGDELFEPLIAERKGAILMIAHIGSFDAMRVSSRHREHQLQLKVLMNLQHGRALNAVLSRINPDFMDEVIDTSGDATGLVFTLRDALAKGDMVAIMADRLNDPHERAVQCVFFGEPVQVPASPWLMAAVLHVPVVMCLSLYHGGRRYSLQFETLIDGEQQVCRAERDNFVQRQAQAYVSRLEACVRLHPYNWFNFYDYWADPAAPKPAK